MKTRPRIRSIALAAVLVLAAAPIILRAGFLRAQESQTAPEGKSAAEGKSKEATEKEGSSKEKEAESDPSRGSPFVEFMARKTGMTVDQAYWLCIGLNFAVVFVLIAVVLKKKLPGVLRSRGEAIEKGIAEARKASEDARRRLAEVEERLARLDSDIAQMRREADDNTHAEERRILAAGEEERRRIVASADQEITMAANAARRELKSYATELAVDLAEKKISITKDADETLVRKFTAQLGKDGN